MRNQKHRKSSLAIFLAASLLPLPLLAAETKPEIRQVRLRDISTVEGVRDNLLIGYGLVVGLKRTGDSQQTLFPTQTLANILQRMGVQITVASVQVRNVAAVFVTA
ncbi:MAG TPA: flagellar basal body P-ring protein FlgI, partial [Candidatus Bathyarchaeia archaeon]|nr:flagellar basal body P-ring protein FlgI [Candidatus Bathyarchaeia archaeon]